MRYRVISAYGLSFAMLTLAALALALRPSAALADAPPAGCANPEQAARVGALYAKGPAPMPFQAQDELALPESTIASALPGELAYGIDGSHFQAVWGSLGAWSQAMVMIRKGGNVFEISTRIPGGEPSKRSKFFNLGHDFPLSGHLRPDLIASIYVISLPGREGRVRGVFFYDAAGESVFGVFLPGEGATPSEQAVAEYDKTAALIRSLPARCAR
jgi:putative heme iron utilization protein